jgi:outer membrane protein TolC
MKAAKIQIEQVESFYNKSTSDIETAISKYYQEMQMAYEQVKEVETSMEFANAYYEARQKSFREGLSTSTELTDASLAVAKAKIERLEAMYQFDVALSKLLYYAGIEKDFPTYQERPGAKFGTY